MIKRIIISGEGGQGIKLISVILGHILSKLGKEVSLIVDYSASVRGSEIDAYLTYSDKKIDNPIFEKADILLELSKFSIGKFKAKRTVCESGLCKDIEIPFEEIAEDKFDSPIEENMIALGELLRLIHIDISKIDLRKEVPKKSMEKHINAIKYGFRFQDELH